MLAYTRAEVDYLNVVARQLMEEAGRLGPDAFQHDGREFAVGDAVILGRNAPRLGVANGTRATVESFDQAAGQITVRTSEGKLVILSLAYLEDRGRLGKQPQSPTLTWGYAVTGHRAQGDTMAETYLRVGSASTAAWAYVGGSRFKDNLQVFVAQGEVAYDPALDLEQLAGPEPQADPVRKVATSIERRSGQQEVAVDQRHELNVRRLPTTALRRRREELAEVLAKAPERRSHPYKVAARRRQQAEQELADAEVDVKLARGAPERLGARPRFAQRHEHRATMEALKRAELRYQRAQVLADGAGLAEGEFRRHEQHRLAFEELHAADRVEARRIARELSWRQRSTARAVEALRPPYLTEMLGPCPPPGRARRAWHRAAELVEDYREKYGITDPEQALGVEEGGFLQRLERREVEAAAARAQEREQTREHGLALERTRERIK